MGHNHIDELRVALEHAVKESELKPERSQRKQPSSAQQQDD